MARACDGFHTTIFQTKSDTGHHRYRKTSQYHKISYRYHKILFGYDMISEVFVCLRAGAGAHLGPGTRQDTQLTQHRALLTAHWAQIKQDPGWV